jgi:MerR family transcriptional regulator, aldehyde-responsive regulator
MTEMFSITKASNLTGISTYTLRYYEKMGVCPPSKRRSNGSRYYTEADILYLQFILGLKETGMSLEHIKEFVQDGCIFDQKNVDKSLKEPLQRRIQLLNVHLKHLEEQQKNILNIIAVSEEKRRVYLNMLEEEENPPLRR